MNLPPTPPAGPSGPGFPGDEDPAARQARLTALALGELSAAEAGELEASIWRDTEARLEVARIRELAEQLTFAYAAEAPASLTPSQHRAILERGPSLSGNDEKGARLTAYALGELRPSQAEMLSARLSEDRAAMLELEAVGALASKLRAAFADEPVPMLTLEQRQTILDRGRDWIEPAAFASDESEAAPPAAAPARTRRWLQSAAIAAGFAALGYLASTSQSPSTRPIAAAPSSPAPEPAPSEIDSGFFPPLPPPTSPSSPKFAALVNREMQRPAATGSIHSGAEARPSPAPEPAAPTPSVATEAPSVAEASAAPRLQPDASVLPPPRTSVAGTLERPRSVPDATTVLHTPMAAAGGSPLTGFLASADIATATLPADLGRAGYDVVRQCLRDFGSRPPAMLVRPEEIINQFDYYVQPAPGQDFAVAIEAADCPWNESHQLVKVTVAARSDENDRPTQHVTVFLRLADTPESERAQLLAWQGLQALASRLRPQDTVSLVVWGRARGMVLPPTSGAEIENLREAAARWHLGGSVASQSDWDMVEQSLFSQATDNARSLCLVLTDGPLDFSGRPLDETVQRFRALNFEFAVAELGPLRPGSKTAALADLATAPYFRADSGPEAARLLAHEISAGRTPVAEDVQIQIAFDPATLAAWRPVGFNAAGRVESAAVLKRPRAWMAGQQVTALYEVVPAPAPGTWPGAAIFASAALPGTPLPPAPKAAPPLSVRLHYRTPGTTTTHSRTTDWTASASAWRTASPDFRLAAGAAAFSLLLQDDHSLKNVGFDRLSRWVRTAAESRDPYGLRREFVGMIDAVRQLKESE